MTAKERQYRIDYEIIVDCYDDYEVNMGWYYYFNDNMTFPFTANVNMMRKDGVKRAATLEILKVTSSEADEIRFGAVLPHTDYLIDVKISDFIKVKTTTANREMLNDWLFWMDKKLLK